MGAFFEFQFSRAAKFEKIKKIAPQENWIFYDLPRLEREIPHIEHFAKPWKNKFSYLVVVGLGGAILGTQAIVEALLPFPKKPKINFLRNLDPTLLQKILSWIDLKKTLFLVVSKSGETLETLTLFDILVQKIYSIGSDPRKHFIVITEDKPSPLFKKSKKLEIPFYPHPQYIGGRYSVLTSVSMLPAALLNLKVKDFFKGAKTVTLNQALKLANFSHYLWKQGKTNLVLFPYSIRLLRLCDWLTQLIAESLGKKGKGITPLTAVGPKDQHSLLQLFLDGPKDKWFLFLSHPHFSNSRFSQKISKIVHAEKEGVKKTFEKKNIPFAELRFHELSELSLGAIFFFFELQIALLGILFQVNPFDQPAVEEAKNTTKRYLSLDFNNNL